MYKCSAKCCETVDTTEDLQQCVDNCSELFRRAQTVITQELQSYQASLNVLYFFIRHFSGVT